MNTNKEFRDICLTIGSIGLVTLSILFIFSLFTALKIGKMTLLIFIACVTLTSIGMSKKNRDRFKSLFASRLHA